MAQPNPVSQLVTLFGLFAALFGTVAPSNAQPIDPATARDSFSGGGLTISAADLQRIAVGLPPRDVHLVNYEWPTTAAAITPSSPLPSDVSAGAVALRPTDATFGNGARRARDKSVLPDDELPTHQLVHQKSPESTSTTHALGSSPTMPPLPPTSTPRGGSGRVLLVECNGAFGYATIQSAIDDAVDGDIVVVLPNDCTPEGRWFENVNFLGKAIRVQSANPQDEAVVNATIIDGNANGTVVTFENGEGLDSVLDGVVVTNGSSGQGGGFSIVFSAPLIRRCVISHNFGEGGAAKIRSPLKTVFESCLFDANSTGGSGSMIFAVHSVVPDLIDCEIRNHGGNLMIVGTINGVDCNMNNFCTDMVGCRFEDNTASTMFQATDLRIDSCEFVNNASVSIGLFDDQGIVVSNSLFEGNQTCLINSPQGVIENCQFISNGNNGTFDLRAQRGVRISNCDFIGNVADFSVLRAGQALNDETTIENCLFQDNSSGYTTVLIEPNANAVVSNCRFINNRASGTAAAMHVLGSNQSALITACLFERNIYEGTASISASTIYCYGNVIIDSSIVVANRSGFMHASIESAPISGGLRSLLRNCTIIGNVSSGPTGGVENVKLENCIVYNNRGAGGVEDQTAQLAPGTVASYCNIQDFNGVIGPQYSLIPSVGNFDLDPRFVDLGYWDDMNTPNDPSDDVFIPGNYHLLPDSPCIDAGDPEFVPDVNATDIDGEARVQSCRVDIGADEFTQDDVIPGDFDGDGFVSLADVPEFLSVALGPVGSQVCLGDLTGDGHFDGRDIAALTALLIGN